MQIILARLLPDLQHRLELNPPLTIFALHERAVKDDLWHPVKPNWFLQEMSPHPQLSIHQRIWVNGVGLSVDHEATTVIHLGTFHAAGQIQSFRIPAYSLREAVHVTTYAADKALNPASR